MAQAQINTNALLSTLRSNSTSPVIFTLDNYTIAPDYHITEIKMAQVNALDCSAASDQWNELVIQLLDGNAASSNAFMQASKFLGILNKATKDKLADTNPTLYFEFAPDNKALTKSSIERIDIIDGNIVIALNALTAQCKPYQRALINGTADSSSSGNSSKSGGGCCGSAIASTEVCCQANNANDSSACCA